MQHPLNLATRCALFLTGVISFLCISCSDNRTEIEQTISEWQGKKITFMRGMKLIFCFQTMSSIYGTMSVQKKQI